MGGMMIGRVTSRPDDAGPKMPRAPIANSARNNREKSAKFRPRKNDIIVISISYSMKKFLSPHPRHKWEKSGKNREISR
jgi:hypothetical protein